MFQVSSARFTVTICTPRASSWGATWSAMPGTSLAWATIGQALAQALVTKHADKHVDRLMRGTGIDLSESFARSVPHQIGSRPDVLVAMHWIDFDHNDQSTLVLRLLTDPGRAARW
jgi:hypothetical protein